MAAKKTPNATRSKLIKGAVLKGMGTKPVASRPVAIKSGMLPSKPAMPQVPPGIPVVAPMTGAMPKKARGGKKGY